MSDRAAARVRMTPARDSISDSARNLLAERIDSATQLEILLLLHRDSSRAWTAAEVAAELRLERQWSESQLAHLARRGLAAAKDSAHRYAPADAALAAAVGDLRRAYAERPATVITLIFSKPQEALRTFADAFRLRAP